ncbi:MAG: alpha/beta hydrolase [Treponema sp.]
MSSQENRKAAAKKLKLLVYNPKCDIHSFRKKIEDAFYSPFLPGHAEKSEYNYGCVDCDVITPEIHSSKRITLYIHGGSFTGGSRASYRAFCSEIANRAFSRVVVPEYRLSPEHPFPAAIEDAQNTFRALFAEELAARSLEAKPAGFRFLQNDETENQPEVVIAADGAGASIALALVLNLRERYRKCIRYIVLFSPWVDLSPSSVVQGGKKMNDGVINSESLAFCAEAYTYAENLTNPLVSPVFASPDVLQGFPPVYMQMGSKEVLLEDARRFETLLTENGVECRLDVWDGMTHLFQMADDYLDEAHNALGVFSKIICGTEKDGSLRQKFDNKPRLERSIRAEA